MSKQNVDFKGAIAVCTPMYENLAHRTYVNSAILLADTLRNNGYNVVFYTVGGDSLITRARNTLIYQALNTENLLGVLFLDADQGVDPEDVLSLIESGKDVIGGIVPKKAINWPQVKNAVLMKEEDLALYSGQYSIGFLSNDSIQIKYDEPVEVKYVGTGLMYVSASVFEKLKPICKTYKNGEIEDKLIDDGIVEFFTTHVTDDTNEFLSEDQNFCRMWRSVGGTVWAAPWVQVVHSGNYSFMGSFSHTVDMISRLNEISKSIENL